MSRVDFGAKPLLFPMPVLIVGTYDENGVPNAMNAAWGSITDFQEISISMSEHKTTANFAVTGAFTVSMATADRVAECDYLGVVSGNRVADKVAACGLHTEKSTFVDAPLICELPMAVECRLKHYDPETCRMVGEIVNVCADESVLTDGVIDPAKLRPITYDPAAHGYYVLGEKVGQAFSDGLSLKK